MGVLSREQIDQFLTDGVLVVDNVLTQDEISNANKGLAATLKRYCGDSSHPAKDDEMTLQLSPEDEASARAFSALSSTNGSGGVLDIFYEDWKMDVAANPKLFEITTELWKAAYCHDGETKESLPLGEKFRWHPYGSFDGTQGFIYIDRIGYRLPTQLSTDIGNQINVHKKKKARAIQRSLTPHLDCCPETFLADQNDNTIPMDQRPKKWRPIQCFVSLTENLEANTGGFEAAKGFHRSFEEWKKNRPLTVTQVKGSKSGDEVEFVRTPPPCVGEYTHIRPKEEKYVLDRVSHVPVAAGSAVFWDNRIPHANAYRHDGDHPRAVVYCSFLPNVELNRSYVRDQLEKWKAGEPPTDQWNHIMENDKDQSWKRTMHDYPFTPLGRKLMGMDPW